MGELELSNPSQNVVALLLKYNTYLHFSLDGQHREWLLNGF